MASHSTRLRVHFEAGGAAGAARGLGGREGGVPKIGVEAPAADIVCLARDDVEEGRDHLVGLDEARSAATQLWLRNLQVRRLSKRVSKGLADAAARLRLVCEARRCPCDERLIERCARLQDPAVIDPRELPKVYRAFAPGLVPSVHGGLRLLRLGFADGRNKSGHDDEGILYLHQNIRVPGCGGPLHPPRVCRGRRRRRASAPREW